MRVLVIFEVQDELLSLDLSELASLPTKGREYVFDGQSYEVVRTIESVGSVAADGQPLGSNEKLLAVMKAGYGNELVAMSAVSKIRSISTIGPPPTLQNGIIKPAKQGFNLGFDQVMFVRCQPSKLTNARIILSALAPDDERKELVSASQSDPNSGND